MFVTNCSVITEQRLRYPTQTNKKGKKKHKQQPKLLHLEDLEAVDAGDGKTQTDKQDSIAGAQDGQDIGDIFNPVKCSVCDTEVGVFDQDEIFHFFNVLASHS